MGGQRSRGSRRRDPAIGPGRQGRRVTTPAAPAQPDRADTRAGSVPPSVRRRCRALRASPPRRAPPDGGATPGRIPPARPTPARRPPSRRPDRPASRPAAWPPSARSGRPISTSVGQAAHGPRGHHVPTAGREGFGPCVGNDDAILERERPDDGLKERGLLADGLDERDLRGREARRERDPRESTTAAQVEDRSRRPASRAAAARRGCRRHGGGRSSPGSVIAVRLIAAFQARSSRTWASIRPRARPSSTTPEVSRARSDGIERLLVRRGRGREAVDARRERFSLADQAFLPSRGRVTATESRPRRRRVLRSRGVGLSPCGPLSWPGFPWPVAHDAPRCRPVRKEDGRSGPARRQRGYPRSRAIVASGRG